MLDLFSSKVSWNLEKEGKISTRTGICLTLVAMISLLIYTIITIRDVSNRTQPIVSTSINFLPAEGDSSLGMEIESIKEIILYSEDLLYVESYPKFSTSSHYCKVFDYNSASITMEKVFEIKPPFVDSMPAETDTFFNYDCHERFLWPLEEQSVKLRDVTSFSSLKQLENVGTIGCSTKTEEILKSQGFDIDKTICLKYNLTTYRENIKFSLSKFVLTTEKFFECSTYISHNYTYMPKYIWMVCDMDIETNEATKLIQTVPIEIASPSLKACFLYPNPDLTKYDNPFEWKVNCVENKNDFVFSSAVLAVKSDLAILGTDYQTMHAKYIHIKSTSDQGDNFLSLQYQGPPEAEYFEYSRRYMKLSEILVSINGIWVIISAILFFAGNFIIDFETKRRIIQALQKKNGSKFSAEDFTIFDFIKAKVFCNREMRKKLNRLETFVNRKFEAQIEIGKILAPKEDDLVALAK